MIVGERIIDPTHPPYIIAELGVNHDGDVRQALRLVGAARAAGADAIKLQWFEAARLLSRNARLAAYQADAGAGDAFEMLHGLELSATALAEVVAAAHDAGLHGIVTLFSLDHVTPSMEIPFDAYKTASPDVINRPLLERLIASGRPLFVSTGAASREEVAEAASWLGDHEHVLMQCVSAYPTPDDCAAIAGRKAMEAISPHAIGYSDHTTAVDTGGLAVAAGACVLEKHLTLDRAAAGPDHGSSLDPEQFGRYVELAHRARRMLGEVTKCVLPIERDVREVSRQSLTTARPLAAGTVLQADDVTIKRPGLGIAPSRLAETVGRRLARAVDSDTTLCEDDLV